MITISQAASLALHSMAILAEASPDRRTTSEIAQRLDASAAHLSKILQQLRRAGLVDSSRGPTGGFALAESPDEITLLEAYEAVEGPLKETSCMMHHPVCQGQGCIFGDLLTITSAQVRSYLRNTTLADVQGRGP